MKLLVLRVFLPDENASADEYEYAVVPLTPELSQNVASKRKLQNEMRKADKDLYETIFWSRDCKFFKIETVALTDDEQSDYYSDDWVVIEREAMFDVELKLEMEMIMMELSEMSMCWAAMPKHEDIKLTTASINYTSFEEALE